MSARTFNRLGLLLAFAPFLIFCAMFELIPVVALLLGSVGGVERHSFEWIAKVFTNPTFQRAIWNSLLLAVTSSLGGAVIGTAIGYAITRTTHDRVRRALVTLSSLSSNAGGISLGFAFITILGSAGMLTILLRQFGIDLLSFFSIYSVIGLIVVYLYFQVPLMIVLMLPAFAGLRADWSEASASLGGTNRDFWRRVGIPVLMPSIVAGTVLLFVSSMGAYATAQALIGSRINLMTIQISILRRGEILYQPAQADAMATVLLAMVAVSVLAYHLIQRRAQRWIKA
ncbi:MAG TPA: ABC transporter permease subunit [Candidatus Limnocylindrales bacterium]|jgi:putative spermidine/putrescine transport system permease protein